jgi:CRP/FNR family cyclic AMP-dependent transcriptional regulator
VTPPPLPDWLDPDGPLPDLSPASRAALRDALRPVRFAPGDTLMRFQEASDHLLFLTEGEIRVHRPDGPDGVQVELGRLGPGRVVGELSFVTRAPRSATIDAVTAAAGWRLDYNVLDELMRDDASTRSVYRVIAEHAVEATARGDAGRVRDAVELSLAAKLLVTVIAIQSGTLIATGMMTELMSQVSSSTVMLIGYLLFITGIGVTYWRTVKLPRQAFGVTLEGWRPALVEALGASAVVMLATVAVKWALVSHYPAYAHVPIFDILDVTGAHGRTTAAQLRVVGASALAYAAVGGFQELYARGMLQGQLYRFFSPRTSNPWPAILVSNLLFASIHVSWSMSLTAMSFFGGLMWGWLYGRRPTLLGVTVSHVLLGIWAGRIVNVLALFKFGPLAVGG